MITDSFWGLCNPSWLNSSHCPWSRWPRHPQTCLILKANRGIFFRQKDCILRTLTGMGEPQAGPCVMLTALSGAPIRLKWHCTSDLAAHQSLLFSSPTHQEWETVILKMPGMSTWGLNTVAGMQRIALLNSCLGEIPAGERDRPAQRLCLWEWHNYPEASCSARFARV